MIDQTSPECRRTLVLSRCHAIQGGLDKAGTLIDDALVSAECGSHLSQIALWMEKSLHLHWDCRDTEALAIFRDKVDPLLTGVSDEVSLIVGYNRGVVAFPLFEHHDQYALADLGLILSKQLWGHESLLHATRAAEQGRRNESLPTIWRELCRTYLQGCWRPWRLACSHLAMECVNLGWPHEAVFHAILAGDKNTLERIGKRLKLIREPAIIDQVVSKILACGQLQHHFMVGSKLLRHMYDAIPDHLFTEVFEWAITRAKIVPKELNERHTLDCAWELLSDIASRLTGEQAQTMADTAFQHPAWAEIPTQPNQVILHRRQMLIAIHHASKSFSKDAWPAISEAVFPLLTVRKQGYDYQHALEVLCQAAAHGGDELKVKLRGMIYPKGQHLTGTLLQVAPHFGLELNKPVELGKDAKWISANVRLQVQRVAIGESGKALPGTLFTQHVDKDGERWVVSASGADDVFAILGQRSVLPAPALRGLINAVCDMIQERENAMTNRVVLADALSRLGSHCAGGIKARVWKVLSPIANGRVEESTLFMTAAQAANPLNPYKMSSGDPRELQAVAICTLAELEREVPRVWAGKLVEIVLKAITDGEPTVRTAGCWAASALGSESSIALFAVLLATRDSDGSVVEAAFSALWRMMEKRKSLHDWEMAGAACERAAARDEGETRRNVAVAVWKMLQTCPIEAVRQQLETIRLKLASDICYHVRIYATGKNEVARVQSPKSNQATGPKKTKQPKKGK